MDTRRKSARFEDLGRMKQACPPAELCKNCPLQYRRYFEYCNKLGFDEAPDYTVLKQFISDAALVHQVDITDNVFDWCSRLTIVPGFSSGTMPARQNKRADQPELVMNQFSSVKKANI